MLLKFAVQMYLSIQPKMLAGNYCNYPWQLLGLVIGKKEHMLSIWSRKMNNVSDSLLQSLLNKLLDASHQNDSTQHITKEEVKRLLNLAYSESEKERLKYSIIKSSGLSTSKAKRLYGFQDMNRRMVKVEDAAEKAYNIRVAIEKIAHIKEKALVQALGIALSSESKTSESESEDESEKSESLFEIIQINENSTSDDNGLSASLKVSEGKSLSCGSGSANRNPELDKNSPKLLDILRKCDLNWLQFKSVARESMKDIPSEIFEEMITCFYDGLSSFGISELDASIVRQSHCVYEIRKSQIEREIDIEEGNVISESDESSSDFDTRSLGELASPFDSEGQVLIKKRRAAIRRKATRDAKRRVAEERLLKRRKSKKVSRILQDCPDIGKTIEDFVQQCGAGADAWRRTGVITFDGNKKIGKKPTFRRVEEHLERKYQSYAWQGTREGDHLLDIKVLQKLSKKGQEKSSI